MFHRKLLAIILVTAMYAAAQAGGARPPQTESLKGFQLPNGQNQTQLSTGSLPRRPAPDGFQGQEVGTGRLLTGNFQGAAKSASMTARGYAQVVGGYFDGGMAPVSGIVDNQDRRAQVMFNGRLAGVPVAGLMAVALAPGGGTVSVLIDRPERIGATLSAMQQGSGASGGGQVPPSRYEGATWVAARAADGSSAVQVPQGWIANGQNGGWEMTGPQGESVVLGVSMQYMAPTSGFNHPTLVPFMDPLRAFQYTYGKFVSAQNIQIIESTQTQSVSGNGPAYFLLAKMSLRGQPYYAWGLSSASPTSQTTWIHYFSTVAAPEPVFAREFRTMTKIWGSWSISQGLINQRMQAALNSMRETNEIMRGTQQTLSDSRARLNHAWGVAFQGNTYVQNTQTGRFELAKQTRVNDVIDELNRQEGAKVWREMPVKDYPAR